MVLLFLASTAAAVPAPKPAKTSAQAVVRVLSPARATESRWTTARHRTDRIIVDEQGRKLRLRTIEFE